MYLTARTRSRRSTGFTLIELAMVVFIMVLLLGSILVPLQSQVESRKYDDTQRILDQAREALLGYAATYGYFPCPADYGGLSNGQEAIGSNHTASGSCPSSAPNNVTGGGTAGVYVGFLPAATLGFTPIDNQGYAVDAWGLTQNRIRYALTAVQVNVPGVGTIIPSVSLNGMRAVGMANIMNANLLNVCSVVPSPASTTACSPASTTLTSNAIAVIWSLGPNAATTGGASANEAENAEALAAADRVFVMRFKSNVAGAEFDDVVTWISPPLLFNRMIAAGQLP